jgi:RNA exonuclease 4
MGEFDSWNQEVAATSVDVVAFLTYCKCLFPMQFNIGFSSTDRSGENQAEKPTEKGRNKRSRRRRNTKSRNKVEPVQANATKKQHDAPMTKSDLYFSLNCEMIGIGPDGGVESAPARVTILNWENKVVLDTFVQVQMPAHNYGSHIASFDSYPGQTMTLEEVRNIVESTLRGKILIGHGLYGDLAALGLTHPWCDVRDTATYPPFMRQILDPETGKMVLQQRKLRDLAWDFLHRQIQVGDAHCPVEDAITSLDLYKAARRDWEEDLIKIMQENEKQRLIMEEQQRLRLKWRFQFPATAPSMPMPTQPLYEQHLVMPFVPLGQVQGNALVQPYQMPCAAIPYPSPPAPHVQESFVQMSEQFATPPPPPSSWFRFVSRRAKSPPQAQQVDLVIPVVANDEEPSIPSEASDTTSSMKVEQEPPSSASHRASSPVSPSGWFRFRRPKSPAQAELVIPPLIQSEESGDASESIFDLVIRPRASTASTVPDDDWFQDMSQLEQELNNLVSI